MYYTLIVQYVVKLNYLLILHSITLDIVEPI